jgi:hypothetical protein
MYAFAKVTGRRRRVNQYPFGLVAIAVGLSVPCKSLPALVRVVADAAPAACPVANTVLHRFDVSAPAVASTWERETRWSRLTIDAGWSDSTGLVTPSRGIPGDPVTYVPPTARQPGWNGAFARIASADSAFGHLQWTGSAVAGGHSAVLSDAVVSVQGSEAELWLGRTAYAALPAHGGGLFIGGDVSFDGGGIGTTHPTRLPGILASLGCWEIAMVVATLPPNGTRRTALFHLERITWRASGAFSLGATRAAMMGGGSDRLSGKLILQSFFLGYNAAEGGFENQVASVDWKLRLGHGVETYGEWGTEDLAGAMFRWPGLVGGLAWADSARDSPRVGIEAVYAGGTGIWARHYAFTQGWTRDLRPIGLDLGGSGSEVRLFASSGPRKTMRKGTIWRLELIGRSRRAGNLYEPVWLGQSAAVQAGIEQRWGGLEGWTDLTAERGDGWHTTAMRAALAFSW